MYGYETFHEELMRNLIDSVHHGQSSHAYIFEGSMGLNTLGAARLFAAALACPNNEIAPCGACPSCIEAKANTNPDIVYVNSGAKKSIGAEQMRSLETDVAIKPFAAKRKIYIIEDGTQLTEAAQNVLLKTFEEPPEYAVFIIVIENAAQLLETVLSRFTLVHFPPVTDETVEKYITEKYPEESERLPFLVRYSAGIPGEADRIISDPDFDALRARSLEKMSALTSSDRTAAFDARAFVEEYKDRFSDILAFWVSFARDMLLIQTGSGENIINADKRDALRSLASKTDPAQTVKLFERILKAHKMNLRFVSPKAVVMWLAL